MFSSHTLFREECIVSQFHLGPRSPPQQPGPVYQVAAWGAPPRTQRQRSGCLHGHAPSTPCEAWPHLAPSFRERKAEWPQLCGWIRGLAWCRGRLPQAVMGAGKGLGAWSFTEAGFLGGECDQGGLTLAPRILNWERKWGPEE